MVKLEKKIKLNPAKLKDKLFLLRIYNFNVQRGNFYTRKTIDLHSHEQWLKDRLKNKYFYVINYLNKSIGYIRYDKIPSHTNKFLISIALLIKFKKRGFATQAFRKSLKKIKSKKFFIIANIKRNNLNSINFFASLGFKKLKKNKYTLKIINE